MFGLLELKPSHPSCFSAGYGRWSGNEGRETKGAALMIFLQGGPNPNFEVTPLHARTHRLLLKLCQHTFLKTFSTHIFFLENYTKF